MRVVLIAAECEPWAKTGGLGDVVDALARAWGPRAGLTMGSGRGCRRRCAESRASRSPRCGWAPGPSWPSARASPLPGHVEPPVDVFVPKYRGVVLPDGATTRPLAVPDPLPRAVPPRSRSSSSKIAATASGSSTTRPHSTARTTTAISAATTPTMAGGSGCCAGPRSRCSAEERPANVLHLHDWQAVPAVRAARLRLRGLPAHLAGCGHGHDPQSRLPGLAESRPGCGLAFPDELAQALARSRTASCCCARGSSGRSWSTPSAPATRRRFGRPSAWA